MILALGPISATALGMLVTITLELHQFKLFRMIHDRLMDEMIRRGRGRIGDDDGQALELCPILGERESVRELWAAVRNQMRELGCAMEFADDARPLLEATEFLHSILAAIHEQAVALHNI